MKHLKLFFALFEMLALNVGNAWGAGNYVKVTTAPSDWSGDYLIVYESGKLAFNGALTTLDAVSNTVSVTISNNQIAATDAINKAKFTINASGHIKSASGFYIGQTSNANGLKSNKTTSYTNTLTINSDASVNIVSGGAYLRYNPTSGQTRFRYYKSSSYTGQKAIHLYKYVEEQGGDEGGEETDYSVTVKQPTNGTIEADKTEAAKGATVTLTATPDEGYKFGAWDVKDASSNAVSVDAYGKFTMPASNVTVSASFVAKTQYTIKWNVAEGSVEDSKVYEGDALGTLPDAPNCSEGKVFVGWTEATSVNPDGSGITYVKETDIPTGDITYNAVYAKEGETKDVETPIVNFTGGGKELLGAIEGITSFGLGSDYAASNAPYQVKLDGSGDYIQFKNSSAYKITTIDIKVKMLGGATTSTLATQTSIDGSTFTNFNSWSISGAQNDEKSTTVTLNEAHNYLRFYFTKGSNVGLGKLVIKALVPQKSYSNYSLDCSVSEKPALIPSTEEIDFGAKYVGVENTKEFTINASNLKGDITLAVTGNYFDVTPKTIASDAIFPQTVTVTYKPEEAGSHTATLKITSTEADDKTISLKGSAKEAKIYTKTDLANITKYDEVLIVGTNAKGSFAMANNDATNSGPKAISVTVDNNTIATDITNIQWSVGNTDGKLIFAPKDTETWLYCTNNNNGLRIGSQPDGMAFEIKDDYIYNTEETRYIGIYTDNSGVVQNWRSYTSINNNIKEQTFAFYIIKGEVPDNVYSITYNTNGGDDISPSTDVTTIPNTLPTPTKEGYNFAGWYTDVALTTLVVTGTSLTDNITLYAKWADPYTVAQVYAILDSDKSEVNAYVQGIVTAITEVSTQYGNATYAIGDTKDATQTLSIYRGNYLANAKFTAENQLKVGDQVVVYGKMMDHSTGGYQLGQGNYIYKLTSAAGKETTTLSWSATTCKVQIGATNTFPTLTKSHDITIKYTSSNTSVATIANDGSITLVAAGTTTITAAIEEDATYAASSASYELTVVEVVPTGIFQLYSGELVEGEYVLVDGAKDNALKAAVAGTTRLAGENVTIVDNAILNPDASIVWNVAKSGTDWTIYNEYEGKYVAGTGAASAAQLLTDGSNQKALWTITGTETYDIVNNVNKASSVNSYLRWGSTYWACYGATTGKALRLYKKIDVPTPTISHPSGTYLGTQNVTISCALATATIYYTINGSTPTTSSASIAAGGTVSITESCTLKAIAVANGKESALVEATYEIVATGGVWVLVDDATALEAGDLLVLASNNHNVVAGTIADGKDFMTSVEYAAFNANKTIMTTLPANAMILTLGGSEGAWTFEYQEMYLNASGTNNSLGTPATTWTITINETGAAISTGGNTIKYNATSPRFKVYGSTFNGNLPQIYKYTADFYTRDLTNNQYGTICLENGGVVVAGAKIFEIAYKNTQTKRVLVDEVVRLKAGVPYVFLPNANQIKIALDGTTAGTASKVNGLQGTFVEIKDGDAGDANNVLEGKHMLYNNSILKCGGNCILPAYRAYFIVDEISTKEKASAPGRQRVALGYQGENAATGLDNITESGVIAPAMQGTYDVLGRQLSEPTATGFYIVNGKKVFVVK